MPESPGLPPAGGPFPPRRKVHLTPVDHGLVRQGCHITDPVPGYPQILAQPPKIAVLPYPDAAHDSKSHRKRCKTSHQDGKDHKFLLGNTQTLGAYRRQNKHNQCRNAEPCTQSPAGNRNRQGTALFAVLQAPVQAALPFGEWLFRFLVPGGINSIPHLLQHTGDPRQHSGADTRRSADGLVQNVVQVGNPRVAGYILGRVRRFVGMCCHTFLRFLFPLLLFHRSAIPHQSSRAADTVHCCRHDAARITGPFAAWVKP